MEEAFKPEFGMDSDDELSSVSDNVRSIHASAQGESPMPQTEAPEPEKKKTGRSKGVPQWLKNKYFLGTASILGLTVAAAIYIGPQEFVTRISSITLPSLSKGDIQQELWQQKIREVESQVESSNAIVKDYENKFGELSSSVSDTRLLNEKIATLTQNLSRLEGNLQALSQTSNVTFSRISTLEEDLLTIATNTGGDNKLKSEISRIAIELGNIATETTKNTKNIGWLANRTKKLEDAAKKDEPVKVAGAISKTSITTKGQPTVRKIQWKVKLANYSRGVAFIQNEVTNQKLRVSIGVNVPNCGTVTKLDPSSKTISAGHCTISM